MATLDYVTLPHVLNTLQYLGSDVRVTVIDATKPMGEEIIHPHKTVAEIWEAESIINLRHMQVITINQLALNKFAVQIIR